MAEWPYSTANWQRLRKLKLATSPWCEGCKVMGKPHVLANTVDHSIAISEGGPAFPGLDGLRSYCPGCHSAKTARGPEAGAVRSSKPRRGSDVNGMPLAPDHPWATAENSAESRRRGKLEEQGNPQLGLASVRRGLPAGMGISPVNDGIKSLSTGAVGPLGDTQTQLVSKGNRNGR